MATKDKNENIDAQEQENTNAQEQENTQDNNQEQNTENPQEEEVAQEEENQDPLDIAIRQVEEMKDKYLRSVAEFDNYRKRTLKEKAELILNGGEKAITALLPILDDMERAMENGAKTDDPQVLKEGMELIYTKFQKTLETLGVKMIDTKDADFDTDLHEAIALVPGMGEDKKDKVLDCVQNGYKLNDKVIRHAKVAVGQ